MKKKIAVAVSLLLVLALSVGGTIAYLTAQTDAITNTFTIGNIQITLKEMVKDASDNEVEATTNAQKAFTVVPGGSDFKKPIITVQAKSEDCWLYAYVENNVQVNVNSVPTTVATLDIGSDWKVVATDGNKTLYRYTESAVAYDAADQNFTVFTTVSYNGELITKDNRTDINEADTIVVKAFAHQSDNVNMLDADKAAKSHYGFAVSGT